MTSPGILYPDVLVDIAQVGDTDVEDQQKLDSKESFPGK